MTGLNLNSIAGNAGKLAGRAYGQTKKLGEATSAPVSNALNGVKTNLTNRLDEVKFNQITSQLAKNAQAQAKDVEPVLKTEDELINEFLNKATMPDGHVPSILENGAKRHVVATNSAKAFINKIKNNIAPKA